MQIDPTFAPAAVPAPESDILTADRRRVRAAARAAFATAPPQREFNFIVRAEIEEGQEKEIKSRPGVVGVFSDPQIQPCLICPGDPPMGSHIDVEQLLCVSTLKESGMTGAGVLVAIVDTGVNLEWLNAHRKTPNFDLKRSWVPPSAQDPANPLIPGELPVDHGTMCAFDVCIAAPKCTLLDVALLLSQEPGSTIMEGFLSDGVKAYEHLLMVMTAARRPGESRSLVVNNSWGMFHPSWDFPVGDPGNYSDNPNHPFNRSVAALERAGADILFAAGNCGANCPDGRCDDVTANAIYGANSHDAVLCVAGVDVSKTRVGYSTIGPGRLTQNKPDISGYTHFAGSEVYSADGGTSAACPVVAGVVAAVRSRRPYDPSSPQTHPVAIRGLICSTAQDLGGLGYDFEHGHGVVAGCELAKHFPPRPALALPDLCKIFPWLCTPEFCRLFPWLCQATGATQLPQGPLPLEFLSLLRQASSAFGANAGDTDGGAALAELDRAKLAYLIGYIQGQKKAAGPAAKPGCGCKN